MISLSPAHKDDDLQSCRLCGSIVPRRLEERHTEWHDNLSKPDAPVSTVSRKITQDDQRNIITEIERVIYRMESTAPMLASWPQAITDLQKIVEKYS